MDMLYHCQVSKEENLLYSLMKKNISCHHNIIQKLKTYTLLYRRSIYYIDIRDRREYSKGY